MTVRITLFTLLISFVTLWACNQKGEQKAQEEPSKVVTALDKEILENAQVHFKPLPLRADNDQNPITEPKVALGKMLYFDTRLSKTGNNSCNSCHNLATFGVDNSPTSKGDAGKFGDRNSPTVLNAALHSMQFWDGRAQDVEEQAGMPILNPVEMAIPSKEFLVKRLSEIKEYQEMFKAAFPDEKQPLTYLNIQKAIAAFERTLITPSRFDKFLEGDVFALNDDERDGLKLFMDLGCIQCHNGATLGGTSLQKFGVYADYRTYTKSTKNDEGRKAVTKKDADKDMFKTPSLRNVAKTGPYFHDGSVADLGEAVKIMAKIQLNKELKDDEVKKILAFLNSLTADVPDAVKQPPAALVQQ
ncbi:MAG: cytochrome-c peroxidase [Chitinophagales bacterium]|nr:cytochrome-c peroxidase [Chitinophagales bacterium]MDW8419051.1 cytochrome-c peroxidase [Chitinophagales bacterium]